jgi:hypothetical protein
VGFTKLIFGVMLAGLGVVLLAGHLGYLPAGTTGFLAHYWPALLVVIGLALLANAMKSPILGWITTLLVIGALGFGAWWVYHHGASSKPSFTRALDLSRPRAETLTLRARVFGGSLVLGSRPSARGTRAVEVSASGVAGEERAEPLLVTAAGTAVLEWPARESRVYLAPLGGDLRVLAPEQIRVRLEAKSLFSEVRADFTRLRPERCDIEAICSWVRVLAPAARPSLVRIRGTLANVELRIPTNCPVRLEFIAPLTFRSLPEDFLEHVGGRSKTKIWTSDGAVPRLLIRVEGPLIHLRVRREALRAV